MCREGLQELCISGYEDHFGTGVKEQVALGLVVTPEVHHSFPHRAGFGPPLLVGDEGNCLAPKNSELPHVWFLPTPSFLWGHPLWE